MSEAMLFKLLDLALNAVALGLEADAIRTKMKEMQANGATADQVAEALVKMRDEAITNAQKAVDGA
jgi:hypothetical protein